MLARGVGAVALDRGPMLTGRNAGSLVCVVECARGYQVRVPDSSISVTDESGGAG